MNIRLVGAVILIVLAYPVGHTYSEMDVLPIAALFAFTGYLFLTAYLIATGFNLMKKGKPW